MKSLTFFLVIVIVLFTSCIQKNKEKLSFDCDSFDNRALYYSDARKYINEDLLLGLPTALKIHPDGFVILKDSRSEEQIVIIDLQDGSVERLIRRGRGPNELINVRDLEIYDKDVWVSGLQEGEMIKLSLDVDLRKFEITKVFDLSASGFFRALPFGNDKFLILSNELSGKRMEIINNYGKTIQEVGSFPNDSSSEDFEFNNALLQSEVTISPDNSHIALICKSIDCIDIYDRNMELIKRLRGPIGAKPEFIERQVQGGKQFVQIPLFFVYETVASNNELFFVSYTGVEVKSEEDFGKMAHQIFSFDWTGTPMVNYQFDTPIICFDVDWGNKRLYCVTQTPEPEILIFDL